MRPGESDAAVRSDGATSSTKPHRKLFPAASKREPPLDGGAPDADAAAASVARFVLSAAAPEFDASKAYAAAPRGRGAVDFGYDFRLEDEECDSSDSGAARHVVVRRASAGEGDVWTSDAFLEQNRGSLTALFLPFLDERTAEYAALERAAAPAAPGRAPGVPWWAAVPSADAALAPLPPRCRVATTDAAVAWATIASSREALALCDARDADEAGGDSARQWSAWAVCAAEAERARRLVVLAELDDSERVEREARREWAAGAIRDEQRRRVRDDFLLATSSTKWFQEMVGKTKAHVLGELAHVDAWDVDYEVMCPYASFGCRHSCARSGLVQHLKACPCAVDDDVPKRSGGADYDDIYVVVCPNAIMGCTAECTRGPALADHLERCPFADVGRVKEQALRDFYRIAIARDVEQERASQIADGARVGVAAAAARAAHAGRDGRGRNADSRAANSDRGTDKLSTGRIALLARLVRAQWDGALHALGAELRAGREEQQRRAEALSGARDGAVELIRRGVLLAFAADAADAARSPVEPPAVVVFGSCAYDMQVDDSDVDVVVVGWQNGDAKDASCHEATERTYVLHRIAQHLRGVPGVRVDRVLDHSRVPIIRASVDVRALVDADGGLRRELAGLESPPSQVKVDLSLGGTQHTGLAAAALCRRLLDQVPALAPAALVVKRMLREADLNDAFTGGLPSYAVVLMLFYSKLHAGKSATARLFEPSLLAHRLSDSSWRDARPEDLLRRTTGGYPMTPPRSPIHGFAASASAGRAECLGDIPPFSLTPRSRASSADSDRAVVPDPGNPTPPRSNAPPISPLSPPSPTAAPAVSKAASKAFPPAAPPSPLASSLASPAASWRPPPVDARAPHRPRLSTEREQRSHGEAVCRDLLRAADLEPDDGDAELARVLLDFLALFGADFTPRSDGISVRRGGRRVVVPRGEQAPMLIEDPLDPGNNVGRASYNVSAALRLFRDRDARLRTALTRRDPRDDRPRQKADADAASRPAADGGALNGPDAAQRRPDAAYALLAAVFDGSTPASPPRSDGAFPHYRS
ncbi:hypothetical protein M885DRAFT_611229 [Pelagophyceae sp. CCMP2097]|nr:hypothetical protein M885DRAFT_611229 [Pelagophyceae sp. CCMP2097]